MKTFTSPEHFTFTNHFNQSLLKNRIAMMNKRKSNWKAFGKYGLFIASIWVSAAFTKSYRAKVAAQIVEKIPELEEVLQSKVIEQPALNDFVWEKPPFVPSKQDSTKATIIATNAVAEADTQQWVSSTKYVVYKGNYLHFLITAKTTFEDLVKIRQELDRHGLGLEVMAWQMDSLGRYLRKTQILLKAPSGPPQLMSRGIDTSYEPISPIAVTIQLKPLYFTDGTFSMKSFSNASQESSLIHLAIADSEFADFDVRWAQSVAEIVERNRRKGIYFVPYTFFPAKSLQKEDTPQFSRAFAIMTNEEQKEVLKVNSSLKNAKFRLNNYPSLLTDIERIPPEKFIKAVKYEVDDKKTNFHEIYMLVYTKP